MDAPINGGAAERADDESAQLRRALEEEKERHLRLRADFENFRRRVSREKDAARDEGRKATLLALLPVFDTLERALDAGSFDPQFFSGVEATGRMFLEALGEAGAKPVETVGHPFDPRHHEVVDTVPPDADVAPGTVVREVRAGWRMGDQLLRPAQVQVAQPRETAEPWR